MRENYQRAILLQISEIYCEKKIQSYNVTKTYNEAEKLKSTEWKNIKDHFKLLQDTRKAEKFAVFISFLSNKLILLKTRGKKNVSNSLESGKSFGIELMLGLDTQRNFHDVKNPSVCDEKVVEK